MKNYIECRPVMLPTEEVDTTLYMSMGHRICHWAEAGNIDYFCHLYLVSEEEIKEGDWCYDSNWVKVFQVGELDEVELYSNEPRIYKKNHCKKIESTTDKSLSIPLIPNSFIERWVNEQGKIGRVKVLMDDGWLQLSFHSLSFLQVIILPTEDKMYSREEMKGFYREYIKHLIDMPLPEGLPFDEWFDKNYPI